MLINGKEVNVNWYSKWLAIFFIASMFPIPEKYDVLLSDGVTLLSERVWYVCWYLVLVTMFKMVWDITGYVFYEICYLLFLGKFVDQIFNPYGLHVGEIIWDLSVVIYCLLKFNDYLKKTRP